MRKHTLEMVQSVLAYIEHTLMPIQVWMGMHEIVSHMHIHACMNMYMHVVCMCVGPAATPALREPGDGYLLLHLQFVAAVLFLCPLHGSGYGMPIPFMFALC